MKKMGNESGIPPRKNKWWHTPLFMGMYGLYMAITPFKLYTLWKMFKDRRNLPFRGQPRQ